MSDGTMEVEMTTGVAGHRWSAKAGDRISLPKKQAEAYIRTGQARRIGADGQPAPLEVDVNAMGPEVHERVISPRESGRRKNSPNAGELTEASGARSDALAGSGRGKPKNPDPEPLDDAAPEKPAVARSEGGKPETTEKPGQDTERATSGDQADQGSKDNAKPPAKGKGGK